MRVVVGRIGRAHGVRGDCSVELRTDEPERRFAVGSELLTESPAHPRLIVERTVWHSGRLLVHFRGIDNRTAAEGIRGLLVEVETPDDELPDGDDEYYDRQLVGLRVELAGGVQVGTVREIVHLPAYEMLAVQRDDRPDALVPFISEFVLQVDIAGGTVVIDPPEGLLDIDLDVRQPADAAETEGAEGP